ncbi:MAG: glycosyltransferase, partial [Candidatus Eisenbacteria bacterium]
MTPRRIALTTLGSLGDLHPYVAIARGLIARGHDAIVATSELYRERVETEGVGFHAVRPDLRHVLGSANMAHYMDARHGSERVARELVLPFLADTFEDT